MARYIEAQISKEALLHNLAVIKAKAPHSKIMTMVKANAYGHGLSRIAKLLQDVDYLGVACIEEALSLRAVGIKSDVVLMEGFFHSNELPLLQQYNLSSVIHHWHQIEMLKSWQATSNQPISVWLKINTGMNRLGLMPEQFQDAYAALSTLPFIKIVGFMSHFAKADQPQDPKTLEQISLFTKTIGDRKGLKSLANSAGIMAFPQSHYDVVRPGLMLYGASPFNDRTGQELGLKPVMHLQSAVIATQQLRRGDQVGYGGIWQNDREQATIALVGCGYGDGYPWHAKTGAPVLIQSKRTTTVGRISMDMIAVDITDIPEVKIGDKVTLWGGDLPVETVAQSAGTIAYELLCSYIERVPASVI